MSEISAVSVPGQHSRSAMRAAGGSDNEGVAIALVQVVPNGPVTTKWANWTCVVLLLAHAGMLAWQGCRDSATWDEVGHLAAGVSHWHLGTFRFYRVNPPLVRSVATAPLTFADLSVDPKPYEVRQAHDARYRPEFPAGERLARRYSDRYFFWLSISRCACIPFSLIGGWICYVWASELYGAASGLLAAFLWVFCPNILAHGHLITPDAGAAAMGVMSSYVFWRWVKHPSWLLAILAGLTLGLAELTKTTWLVLFLLWPILWIGYRQLGSVTGRAICCRRELLQFGTIVLLAIHLINVGYLFEGSLKPLGNYRFISQTLRGPDTADGATRENRFESCWLGRIPVPLPEDYLLGIDQQKWDFEQKPLSYLRGEWRKGGWWYYYLYALSIKVPVGTLAIFCLAAILGGICKGYAAPRGDELFLLLPAIAVLTLVSTQTGFNHHLRYVLPAFPFAFIFASKVARSIHMRHHVVTIVVATALVWSITSSLLVYPHSLSYYNELVGGPKYGHFHLGNSNSDWGQDLLYLKEWVRAHPEAKPLHLAYDLPLIDPEIVGIEYQPVPVGNGSPNARGQKPMDLGPLPGWHAVSVNWLHAPGRDLDYFLNFKPVAMAGYSIYIYHIDVDEANRVRWKLGLPELGSGQGIGR